MATRDTYSSDELAKIKADLQKSLGDDSAQALDNLDNRFIPSEQSGAVEEETKSRTANIGKETKVDVEEVVRSGNIPKMVEALHVVSGEPQKIQGLLEAILRNGETKSFHLVEALKILHKQEEWIDILVEGITSRKGVNPLIEALKYAGASKKSVNALAKAISEQGTVNHIMRALAGAPKGQDEAEITWTMEVIGKGSLDQIIDSLKLIETSSPGSVVLATGVANRKGVQAEVLVRALSACKENHKAAVILTRALAQMLDVPALVSLMEKYLPDTNPASELVAAQLVHKCVNNRTRNKEIASACRFVRSDSVTGRILALGLIKKDKLESMVRTFKRLPGDVMAKKMLAQAVIKKKGKLMSLKELGKEGWDLTKSPGEIQKATNAAIARYQEVLTKDLGEENPEPLK